jgi:uncharacterized protein (TIRG00374 family)
MVPETEAESPPRGTRHHLSRRFSRLIQFLLVALLVHLFVLPQIGGFRDAADTLQQVRPIWLAAALALYGSSLVVYAFMTRMLIPEDAHPPFRRLLGVVLASTGLNHVIPGGAATTAAVNFRLLSASGVPREDLGVALTIQGIGSALVLNMLLWLALIVSIPGSGFPALYATAAVLGTVLFGLFIAAFLGLTRGRDTVVHWGRRISERIPGVQPDGVESALHTAGEQFEALRADPERLMKIVGLAAANWLFDAAALWVTLYAFGVHIGVDGLIVAYGLANVLAAIPVTPGGLGVVEAVLIPTLIAFGGSASGVSVAVVSYRVIAFWLPIPIGSICYVVIDRSKNAKGAQLSFVEELVEHHPGPPILGGIE